LDIACLDTIEALILSDEIPDGIELSKFILNESKVFINFLLEDKVKYFGNSTQVPDFLENNAKPRYLELYKMLASLQSKFSQIEISKRDFIEDNYTTKEIITFLQRKHTNIDNEVIEILNSVQADGYLYNNLTAKQLHEAGLKFVNISLIGRYRKMPWSQGDYDGIPLKLCNTKT